MHLVRTRQFRLLSNHTWEYLLRPKTSLSFLLYLWFIAHVNLIFTRALSGMMSQYRGTKSRSSLEATPRTSEDDAAAHALVLPSSTELFYFYAQNLEQCAKLFTGQPLYDLCQLHKKWLRIYAGLLNSVNVSCYLLTCPPTQRMFS